MIVLVVEGISIPLTVAPWAPSEVAESLEHGLVPAPEPREGLRSNSDPKGPGLV